MEDRWAPRRRSGFTIVELLIVIVVISILATISVVAYNGVTKRAQEAVLKKDLSEANKAIAIHQIMNGSLPTADNCSAPGASEICLKGSPGTTFSYAPNFSASPASYQLLATRSGMSIISQDGSDPKVAYGSRFVTLTNMATNGDFSSGSTGWTGSTYCSGETQCLFSGGQLTIVADPSGTSRVMQYISAASSTDQDKIFYSARARKDSGSGFTMEAHRTNGGYGVMILTEPMFNAAPTGQFVRYSAVRTYSESQGTSTGFRAGSSSSGKTFQVTVDDVVVINLTSTFGAGNEPSAAAMEGILSQFGNG